MTDLDLDAIEARANAATPGPWGREEYATEQEYYGDWIWVSREPVDADDVGLHRVCPVPMEDPDEIADAEFIAHARTDVPVLVAEVRRLRALVQPPAMVMRPIDESKDVW